MHTVLSVILVFLLTISCSPSKNGLFSDRRSDHQKYADKIKEAGLDKTTMGSQWFAAADRSLEQPLNISLPFKEAGYFSPDKPSAAGYKFQVRRGDRIFLTVKVIPDTLNYFFAELWQPAATVSEAEMIASIDST